MTKTHKVIKKHHTKLTPKSHAAPVAILVDDTARLREIRKLVEENNKSIFDDNLIIFHIYMESRFDSSASVARQKA